MRRQNRPDQLHTDAQKLGKNRCTSTSNERRHVYDTERNRYDFPLQERYSDQKQLEERQAIPVRNG